MEPFSLSSRPAGELVSEIELLRKIVLLQMGFTGGAYHFPHCCSSGVRIIAADDLKHLNAANLKIESDDTQGVQYLIEDLGRSAAGV